MKKMSFGAFLVIFAAAARRRVPREIDRCTSNIGGGFDHARLRRRRSASAPGAASTSVMIIEPPTTPTFGIQVEYGYNGLGGEGCLHSAAGHAVQQAATSEALIESHYYDALLQFQRHAEDAGQESLVEPYAIGGGGSLLPRP